VKTKNILFFALIVVTLFSFSYVANSYTPIWAFKIVTPHTVSVQPGQQVTFTAGILNLGVYWLHEFNLSSSGLPSDFQVEISPNYFETVRIVRDWNYTYGGGRIPEPFNITIKVPDTASGAYSVNITGQEFRSYRKIANSTGFILLVGGNVTNVTAVQGVISITDLIVPETIEEFKAFNVTFSLVNSGDQDQNVNISLQAPSDWTVTAGQSISVPANNSVPVVFSIIPTATSGNLAVVLGYPYQQTVLNLTKAGPYLVPSTNETVAPVLLPSGLMTFVQENTVLTIIIAIVILILIWYFVSTYSFYQKRKKPEEMKKQIDTTPKVINTSSQDEAIFKQ
jgi:preprotein translocase subunit YajC